MTYDQGLGLTTLKTVKIDIHKLIRNTQIIIY